MISKNNNGGYTVGTLYGKAMEGLVFAFIGTDMKRLQDIFGGGIFTVIQC